MEIEHETMTRMRSRYRESLPDKLERLRTMQGRLDQSGVLTELRAFAHQLAGSGATFGWPEISDAAAHVEHADATELAVALGRLIEVVGEAIAVAPG
ncbi:MAG: Hpt domain-containing protein [Myxococcota bacterium]